MVGITILVCNMQESESHPSAFDNASGSVEEDHEYVDNRSATLPVYEEVPGVS
jgi:hypothetical protein